MTAELSIKTLEYKGKGQYGMSYSRTLAWDETTGLGVLVEDAYGGGSRLEGGAYRPHLYRLDESQVRAAIELWDQPASELTGWVRGWERWWYDHTPRRCMRYYGEINDALIRHVNDQDSASAGIA